MQNSGYQCLKVVLKNLLQECADCVNCDYFMPVLMFGFRVVYLWNGWHLNPYATISTLQKVTCELGLALMLYILYLHSRYVINFSITIYICSCGQCINKWSTVTGWIQEVMVVPTMTSCIHLCQRNCGHNVYPLSLRLSVCLCLFVCVCVCYQDTSRSYWCIWTKFCGMIALWRWINRSDFGTDLDLGRDFSNSSRWGDKAF